MSKKPKSHASDIYAYLDGALDDYFGVRSRSEDDTADVTVALVLILADILSSSDTDGDSDKCIKIVTRKLKEIVADLREKSA